MQSGKKYLLLILFFITSQAFTVQNPVEPTAYQYIQKMFSSARQVQSLKYNLVKQERIKGKLKEERTTVKLVRNPFKVYMKQDFPNAGLEVLYVTGANGGKALINTNSFPYVTVSLDPLSATMREDQHHTLHNAGFDYVINTIEFLLDKYKAAAPNMVKQAGDISWNGRTCHKIIMDNPGFKYIDYQVKQGETVLTIAGKFRVSEYMIVEINRNVNNYVDIKPGQIIKIPNDYAKKMVIYLDKQLLLPVLMQIYDDKGLYEQYEFQNLQLNPQFHAAEFTKDYKDYKF